MAEIDDKPKAKVEAAGEEPDNSHLRGEDKKDESSQKPEDKGASETKEGAEKPETQSDKGDKAAASQNLLEGLSTKDFKDFAAFKKAPLQAEQEPGLKGLDLFSKDAPQLSFEREKRAEQLLLDRTPWNGEKSDSFNFARSWNSLGKTNDFSGFLNNEGCGDKSYLSEKFGIGGRFCNPFEKGQTFNFDNGMAVVGFQPALAGAEGKSAMKDFGFDKVDSKSADSGWNWDTVLDVFESGKNAVNSIRAKISNVAEDLGFGLGDHSVDKAVEQLKKSGTQNDSFDRFAEKSATENAKKFLGSAEINYDSFKVQDSTVQVSGNKDQVTHTIKGENGEKQVITQSRPDENGKRDFATTIGDTSFKQDKNGNREITNANSDIKLQQKPDGSVEAFDKSGKKLFDFKNSGDANLYFNNAVAEVVKPGESIEAAYQRLQKEHGDEIKGKPVIVVDGKGESLTIQPDGTRVRNHANGNAEMVFKAKDADGKEHDIFVKVRKGEHGQFIRLAKAANGEEIDVNDKRALSWLKGSKLDIQNGQLMIDQLAQMPAKQADATIAVPTNIAADNNIKPSLIAADKNNPAADAPANQPTQDNPNPHRRHHWVQLLEHNKLNISPDTKIDTITGAISQKDGNKETVITPNKETGVAVAHVYKLKEDGSRESEKPIQSMKFDHGKTTVHGEHPADTFTFDANKKELSAFNTVVSRPHEKAVLTDEHGNRTEVDPDGDFHTFDRHGREIAASDGDHYSYDNGASSAEYHERRSEQQTAGSRDAVSSASAVISEAASWFGRSDISLGAIAGMRGNIAAIRAKCGALGIDVPGEVSAAESVIDALQMKASIDTLVGQSLQRANLNTVTLRDVANNITGSPEDKARGVLKFFGIALPGEKH